MKAVLTGLVLALSAELATAAPQAAYLSATGGAGGAAANRAALLWDNGAATGNALSSQMDLAYPFDSQTADDFRLADQNGGAGPYVITDVHWDGVYWNGFPGNPAQGFNIQFYADAGNKPTGGPGNPNGTAVTTQFIPIGSTNETATVNGFSYDTVLTLPFLATATTRYWLGVQAVLDFTPQWGWSVSTLQQGIESQFGFPLLGANYWVPSGDVLGARVDQAYTLGGFEIPEPTTLALLGLGALAIGRRGRR